MIQIHAFQFNQNLLGTYDLKILKINNLAKIDKRQNFILEISDLRRIYIFPKNLIFILKLLFFIKILQNYTLCNLHYIQIILKLY